MSVIDVLAAVLGLLLALVMVLAIGSMWLCDCGRWPGED